MKRPYEYHRDEHRVHLIIYHLIIYHLIWCPRRREPVLVGPVGPVGPVAARRRELTEGGKCDEKGWEIGALAIQPDHSHLLVCVWPSASAAEVVKEGQGATSSHLRNAFAQLLNRPSTWTRSYVARTAGNVSQETLQRYIAPPTGG